MPVVATRPATRPVSTARGGYVVRPTTSAPAASRYTGRASASRFVIPSSRDRGVIASRGAGRYAATQGRQQRGTVMRSGFNSGYQSTMLRGTSGRFASMSACSTVRGRRVCGGSRQVAMRWSGGLAPAAGIQSSCPDGTMATLAVGHENVVRCVPM